MRLIKTICVLFLILHTSWAGFDPSRFNFGADWDFLSKNLSGSVADGIDYATIWLNDPSFNQYWHGDMLKFCRDKGKTPVFYAYIIAKSSGLGDCDVNGGLCHKGAEYLRNNFNAIKGKYEDYAQKTSSVYGTSKPIIWLMEPDYFQYFSDGRQSVKLSYQDAATYMNEMIACVKKHLPNALFSLDISPWNNDQSSWINSFDKSKFSFMHTSGGRTEAGGDRIRYDNNNNVTWASVNQISGKCIIADDGYGQGGGSTGHDPTWDDLNNIKNRINNGVAAITQKSPRTDWGNTINSLKSSLSGNPTKCTGVVFKIAYSLTVNAGEGGTVEKSPDASAYDSGTTVTLTAKPANGYKFIGWSGDATGSNASISVKMDRDKEISAEFFKDNGKPIYTLTITTTGSGVVIVDPQQTYYDSGTVVTLSIGLVGDGTFTGWGGALSGSDPAAVLTMNGNKTVTASFTGSDVEPSVNLVTNGDFADGETGWSFGAYENGKATGAIEGGLFKIATQSAGTEDWHIQLMQDGISLVKGERVRADGRDDHSQRWDGGRALHELFGKQENPAYEPKTAVHHKFQHEAGFRQQYTSGIQCRQVRGLMADRQYQTGKGYSDRGTPGISVLPGKRLRFSCYPRRRTRIGFTV